jgi:hypothetical protein
MSEVVQNKFSLLLNILFQTHTNITTIYNECENRNCLQKLLRIPSSQAWVVRSRNLQLKGAERKGLEVKWEMFD